MTAKPKQLEVGEIGERMFVEYKATIEMIADRLGRTRLVENRERDYFVSREDAERIIAECPDNEWRLIVALCRFGGLRCPSELMALEWSAVD